MTAPDQEQDDYCPNCTRFGLSILPVRYAAARNDEHVGDKRAPALAAPFGDGVRDISLPETAARYTMRALRRGYLYVFNEVRGQWSGYEVDDDGWLKEFDLGADCPPPPTADKDSKPVCSRHGQPPLARCILIPDAEHAGRVWLAFTAVAWTPQVLQDNRKEAVRKRHMRCIDVGAWVKGKGEATQPHLDTLARAGDLVGEYHITPVKNEKMSVETAYKAFGASPQLFQPLKPEFERLKTAAQRSGERWGYVPAMVALDDPCGIATELGRIAGVTLGDFLKTARNVRPIAVSQVISGIRAAIEEDAENRKIYRTDLQAYQVAHGSYMSPEGGGGQAIADYFFPEQRKARDALYEKWRNPSLQELRQARDDAWKKYLEKYDEPRRQREEKAWKDRLEAYDKETTLPLAKAHSKWMEGAKLLDYIDCNCDKKDAHSGEGLIAQLTMCISDTQQYAPCFALYERWLSATATERENLLLRAFGYNQTALLERLGQAVPHGGLEPSTLKGLPWDPLIKGYDEALKNLSEGGRNAVVRLAAAVGGPLAKAAGKMVDGVVGPTMVWLGLIARSPVLSFEWVGPRTRGIVEMVGRMSALNPKVPDTPELRRAIDIEMRKAEIRGMPSGSKGQFSYFVMADPRVVEDFPGMGPGMTERKFAEAAIVTDADRARLTQMRWRKLMPSAAGLGLVTGILQVVALTKLADDLDKSMVHVRTENQWRFGAGMAGLAGTVGETFGEWSKSAATAGNRLAAKIEQTIGRWLRLGFKALGVAAGLAMAAWDIVRGGQEYSEGNKGVGILYFLSAGAAVGAMFAFSSLGPMLLSALGMTAAAAAATVVGIVLVVLVIVIAVLIEIFKDNSIQDWLERCYFGKSPSAAYNNRPALEMEELHVALKG